MILADDWSFGDFLLGVIYVFGWAILFWLVITVFIDVIRRRDMSGLLKAFWALFVILVPLFGVLVYFVTQHQGMAERSLRQVEHLRGEIQEQVGFSVADELEKLDRMRAQGKISDVEYDRLRARLVQ
jgi:Phospholipase_D-nuclease N-terminal/Short C-terminal domain